MSTITEPLIKGESNDSLNLDELLRDASPVDTNNSDSPKPSTSKFNPPSTSSNTYSSVTNGAQNGEQSVDQQSDSDFSEDTTSELSGQSSDESDQAKDSDVSEAEEAEGEEGEEEEQQQQPQQEERQVNSQKKRKRGGGKKSKNKQRKRSKVDPNRRRKIRKVKSDDELALEVINARKEEEERIRRQAQMMLEFQKQQQQQQQQLASTSHSFLQSQVHQSQVIDEICLSSDDEEPATASALAMARQELIDLCDEEDAAREASTSSGFANYNEDDADENGQIDLNNCGLFSDDRYNVPDENGRVLINVGHPENEDDIFLPPQIARAIKPHQIGGVRFMYANIVESREKFAKSPGVGCILAHSMGLGKTLQVISLIDVFLTSTPAKTVLCIVPINTLQNWVAEFDWWLPKNRRINDIDEVKIRKFVLYDLNECKTLETRCREITHWMTNGGVLLLGYEMYRILSLGKVKFGQAPVDSLKEVQKALVDPGPDLVVCDEGHRIKNCHSSISKALKKIKTQRRIVLTGYPLQNNLMEYWCMVDWVRPMYLGTDKDFANMFEKPIKNGQCQDSTFEDKRNMKYRAHVLHHLLRGFVQRRSQTILKCSLPTKFEYVFLIRMSEIQRQLFAALIEDVRSSSSKFSAQPILLFSVCNKIWNHPDILYYVLNEGSLDLAEDLDLGHSNGSNKGKKKMANKSTGSLHSSFLTPQSSSAYASSPSSSSCMMNPSMDLPPEPLDNFNISAKPLSKLDYDWAKPVFVNYTPNCLENSYKMSLLFTMIDQIVSKSERLLLFSQSLLTLNLIEKFLAERKVPGKTQKWKLNLNYYRLDGSTSSTDRDRLINTFNSDTNVKLFLLSTRAGSLGINLIGANRIIVFDASWNPCHDAQAACRIYRYGQTKNCYIYRLICDNSYERTIYDRQVSKQGLSHRVVDELNPETSIKEIASLLQSFNVEEAPPMQISYETLEAIPDQLVKDICTHYTSYLTKEPFQHESLLLDHKESKLTQFEKQMAFNYYQADKRAKDAPKTFCGTYGSGPSGISTGTYNLPQGNNSDMGDTFNFNRNDLYNSMSNMLNGNNRFNGPQSSVARPSLLALTQSLLPNNRMPFARGQTPSILKRPLLSTATGTFGNCFNSSSSGTVGPVINPNHPSSSYQMSSPFSSLQQFVPSSSTSSDISHAISSFSMENQGTNGNTAIESYEQMNSVHNPHFGWITTEEQVALDEAKRRLERGGYVLKFPSRLPSDIEMVCKQTNARTYIKKDDICLIYQSTGNNTVFVTRNASIVDAGSQCFRVS